MAEVDQAYRRESCKHHTAVHLLHAILRKRFGTELQQRGSLVQTNRMRLDFTLPKALSEEDIEEIESEINQMIQANARVSFDAISLQEAKASGVLALFEERYQHDRLRVVRIQGAGAELCGGTHVAALGELGLFCVEQEQSIAASVRRIEALTGVAAWESVRENRRRQRELGRRLGVPSRECWSALHAYMGKVEEQKQRLQEQSESLDQWVLNHVQPTWSDENSDFFQKIQMLPRIYSQKLLGLTNRLLAKTERPGALGLYVQEEGRILFTIGFTQALQMVIPLSTWFAQLIPLIPGCRGGGKHRVVQGTANDSSVWQSVVEREFQQLAIRWSDAIGETRGEIV